MPDSTHRKVFSLLTFSATVLPRCFGFSDHKGVLVAPFRTASDNPTKQYSPDEDAEDENVHEDGPIQVHLGMLEWERERRSGWSRLACDEYSIHGWIREADKAHGRRGRGGIRLRAAVQPVHLVQRVWFVRYQPGPSKKETTYRTMAVMHQAYQSIICA